jgi:hypothetical protein
MRCAFFPSYAREREDPELFLILDQVENDSGRIMSVKSTQQSIRYV